MNKQRYLAELQRLLVFMTEEDRELVVHRYGALFDEVGPEGEQALAERIGSPTKAAISLSRGYEPGHLEDVLGAAPEEVDAADAAPAPAEPEAEKDPWDDLPDFELPDLPGLELGEETGEKKADPAPAPAEPEPPEEEERREISPRPIRPPQTRVQTPPPPVRATVMYERRMPLALGVALFIPVAVIVCIPLAVLCLGAMLLCLCPGLGCLLGAWLSFVGGLWCLGYMADAIMMFGLALLALALGLMAFFGGLWLDVRIVRLYILVVERLAGVFLGRKVTVYE